MTHVHRIGTRDQWRAERIARPAAPGGRTEDGDRHRRRVEHGRDPA